MSTRCQIGIYDDDSVLKGRPDKLPVPRVLIYRHSDGYPGNLDDGSGNGKIGVVPDILPFLRQFIKVRGYDVEYMGASLVAYLKQFHCGAPTTIDMEYRCCGDMEVNGIKINILGHGICNSWYGGTEYIYCVIPNELHVYSCITKEYIERHNI